MEQQIQQVKQDWMRLSTIGMLHRMVLQILKKTTIMMACNTSTKSLWTNAMKMTCTVGEMQ